MPPTLYKRQRQIVDFLAQYIQKNGYSPTLQEIAQALNVSSLATVHEHLQALARKKVIRKQDGAVRGIELIDRTFLRLTESMDLPLMGYIAAGQPIQPFTDPNATFKVSPEMVSGKKAAYVLQVKGESMIEDGILDGYFVVIDSFLTHVGISAKMTMVVASLGQGAEIITMLALGAVLRKLGWKWTMVVGILGHALRYGVFALFAESGATAW